MNSPDIALFLWINASAHTPAAVVLIAQFASHALPGIAGAALLLAAGFDRRLWSPVAQALTALLLAWIAVRLLRMGMPMPRPAALGLGTQWIEHGNGPGFPSLHTAGAFAVAGALLQARLPIAWKATALATALLIGWSRLCLGVHFPSDVAAGLAVGIAAAHSVHWLAALWPPTTAHSPNQAAGHRLSPPPRI